MENIRRKCNIDKGETITKKKLGLVVLTLILSLLITVMATSCNNHPEQPDIGAGRGLSVSFLKDFTFDLDGVVSLGIEKRPVKKKVSKMVAYADDEEEKNYLVGETEDREVIKIMLLNKLGEAYSQDELPAQFNKLCVSGNFIFFELIPADVYDNISEYGSYYFYSPEDLDDNGNPIEGATPNVAYIPLRENQAEEDLEDFDKSSTPNAVSGAFVYSMENEKIYDLSETGYEVIGNGVVSMSGEVYRVSINEELILTQIADTSFLSAPKVFTDIYGNVFIQNGISYSEDLGFNEVDLENRVFYYSWGDLGAQPTYIVTNEGIAIELVYSRNNEGVYTISSCKAITEQAEKRELTSTDNLTYNWGLNNRIKNDGYYVFKGIREGIPIAYRFDIYYEELQNLSNLISIEASSINYAKRLDLYNLVLFTENILYAYNEESNNLSMIYEFSASYSIGNEHTNSNISWTETTKDGKTKKEAYYNEETGEIEVRLQSEQSAVKEIKKFQPIT